MKLGEKKASLGGLVGKLMRFPRETEITSVIAIHVDVLMTHESRTLKCAAPVAFTFLPSTPSSAHMKHMSKDAEDRET